MIWLRSSLHCWCLLGACIHVLGVTAAIAVKVKMPGHASECRGHASECRGHASECREKSARGRGLEVTSAAECMHISVQDAQTMEIMNVWMLLSW